MDEKIKSVIQYLIDEGCLGVVVFAWTDENKSGTVAYDGQDDHVHVAKYAANQVLLIASDVSAMRQEVRKN